MFDTPQPPVQPPQIPAIVPSTPLPTPPSIPPATPQSVPESAPERVHVPHKKIWIGLFAVLVLAAAGVFAAYHFYGATPTPEKVLAKVVPAMAASTSTAFRFSVEANGTGMVDGKGDGEPRRSADIVMTATADGAFSYSKKLFDGDIALHTTADGETIFGFAGETRSVDGVDYVQLTEIPRTALPIDVGGSDALSALLNRWIVIDRTDIAKSLHLEQVFSQLDAASNVDASNDERIDAMLAEYFPQIIGVTATLPNEDIDGVPSYHYAYTLNEAAMRQLASEIQIALGENFQQGSFDALDAFLDNADGLQGELWIAKATNMISKVTMNGKYVSKGERVTFEGPVAFTATLALPAADGDITVDVPENATPIIDVMREVMAKTQEFLLADDDTDGVTNVNEDKHGTDPKNPDTDGDGYSDGDEIKSGYNPLGPGKMPIAVSDF